MCVSYAYIKAPLNQPFSEQLLTQIPAEQRFANTTLAQIFVIFVDRFPYAIWLGRANYLWIDVSLSLLVK